MKWTLLIVIHLSFLHGCASRANLEWNLNTWIVHDVNGLIQHWGTPTNIDDLSNGSTSFTWLFDDGISNTPIEGTINSVIIYCKITVDVSTNDTIQSWKMEGNDCKA